MYSTESADNFNLCSVNHPLLILVVQVKLGHFAMWKGVEFYL